MDDDTAMRLGLLGAAVGALIELVSEARTAITEQWDEDHPATLRLIERIDAFLGPIAEKQGLH